MQCGAIAVVLVSSTLNAFDLDRFFVPKELILRATAVVAGLLALRAIACAGVARIDLLLAGYLLLSALSAAMATNRWLAMRALAISASSAVLFWTARGLRQAGLARPLLGALALAVVLAAVTSLLQAYGMRILLFSENRAPGGDARQSQLRRARRRVWTAAGSARRAPRPGVRPQRNRGDDRGRVAGADPALVIFAGCGVGAALLIPNRLRWRRDNPYLESVQRAADYQRGAATEGSSSISGRSGWRRGTRCSASGRGTGLWSTRRTRLAATRR